MAETFFSMEVGIWFLVALAAGIAFFMYCCFNPQDTKKTTWREQLAIVTMLITCGTNGYYWLGSMFYHWF